MGKQRKAYLYAGTAVFFWSTIATAFKLALAEISVLQLLTVASFTSTIVLGIIILAEGSFNELMSQTSKDILSSALLAVLNPLVYYIVLLKAYSLLPAQVAQPLNMIWPIVLVFLSVPLLKQKIPGQSFLALFISFAGVYLISSQGQPFSPGKSDPLGILLATGSSIFWALYFILNLKDRRKPTVKLFTNFLLASFVLLIILLYRGELSGFSPKGLLAATYIGIFEMGLTFFLWLKALGMTNRSDRISNLVFLAPFLSLVFISLILREKIHLTTLAGLIVIVFSLLLQNYYKAEKKVEKRH